MKTLLLLVIVCCSSEKGGVYTYETKNLTTNENGQLYTMTPYNVGDTVKLNLR